MIEPIDERDHMAGPSSAWSETWEFRGCTPDLTLAVAVAVVRRPAEGQMSYRAVLLGRSRPPIVVVEHEIAPPRNGLEIRGSGIWADQTCEEPHSRWSLGLEAFALALDDPVDLIVSGRGLPVALGFDLEWEAEDGPTAAESVHDDGYLAVGSMFGEVLLGDDTFEFAGPAGRAHRWGTGPAFPDWWCGCGVGGAGMHPWPLLGPVARVLTPDPVGRIAELCLAEVTAEGGVPAPGWASAHLDE